MGVFGRANQGTYSFWQGECCCNIVCTLIDRLLSAMAWLRKPSRRLPPAWLSLYAITSGYARQPTGTSTEKGTGKPPCWP